MILSVRTLSGLFSAIPVFLFGACALTLFGEEYYWTSYVIMTLIFFGSSVILGLLLPTCMHGGHFDYPWLWLFIAGGLAWLVALLTLSLLNITPLCVGQNNGDGTNSYSLCVLYIVLATLVYSPVELVLLALSAFIGGKIQSALIRAGEDQTLENLVR